MQDVRPKKRSFMEENESMNSPENFRFFARIGIGTNGTNVHLAYHCQLKNKYAVKCIRENKTDDKANQKLKREIDILASIRHAGIIGLYGNFQLNGHHCLVLDYMDGGDLLKDLHAKKRYTEFRAQAMAADIAMAVKHCHDNQIVHRDIKPENILLDRRSGRLKLCDFGLAVRVVSDPDNSSHHSSRASLTTRCGTLGYMAPEVLLDQLYGMPVDMWGMGVLFYIILGGYHPFDQDTDDDLTNRLIVEGKYQFHQKYWHDISEDATSIIDQLLVINPEKRMNAADLSKSLWLKEKNQVEVHKDNNLKANSSWNPFKNCCDCRIN